MFDSRNPEEKAAMQAYNKKINEEAAEKGITPPKNPAAFDVSYYCSATPEQLAERGKEANKPCRCKDGFTIGKLDCCRQCRYFIGFESWRIFTNQELLREIRVFEELKKAWEAKIIVERNEARKKIEDASYNLYEAIVKNGITSIKKS